MEDLKSMSWTCVNNPLIQFDIFNCDLNIDMLVKKSLDKYQTPTIFLLFLCACMFK